MMQGVDGGNNCCYLSSTGPESGLSGTSLITLGYTICSRFLSWYVG